jgi:hypothetical protein
VDRGNGGVKMTDKKIDIRFPDKNLMGMRFVKKCGMYYIYPARDMNEKEKLAWKEGLTMADPELVREKQKKRRND